MSYASVEQRRFGLAKESVRGTAESTPTKWFPVDKDTKLSYDLQHLKDEALRGIPDVFPSIAGVKVGGGKIKLSLDAQMCSEFFYSLLGDISSAEESEITIDSTNNKLDFNIGGSELNATISSGSYAIGTTSAVNGTLCDAIKDALFAADATGTYTVTYSRTTRLFTIARSTGTFVLLAATGLNIANGIWSTIGFPATDRSAALTYDGTTAVNYAFLHTITRDLDSIERQSYTFFLDYGASIIKKVDLGVIKSVTLTCPVDQLITLEAETLFQSEADGSIGSPSFPTQRYMAFQHATVKVGGATNTDIRSWQLKIDGGSQILRTLNQSQDVANILVKAPLMITGNFVIFFQTDALRDAFLANTTTSLQFLIEQDIMVGTLKWKVDITLPKIQYKAMPFGEQDGLLAASVDFDAVYDVDTTKSISIAVRNQDVSY